MLKGKLKYKKLNVNFFSFFVALITLFLIGTAIAVGFGYYYSDEEHPRSLNSMIPSGEEFFILISLFSLMVSAVLTFDWICKSFKYEDREMEIELEETKCKKR